MHDPARDQFDDAASQALSMIVWVVAGAVVLGLVTAAIYWIASR